MRKKRPRLPAFDHPPLYRYFLTFCTADRHHAFGRAPAVSAALEQILLAAAARGFAVIAYVFMPDQLHLLVEGLGENSELRSFVHLAKQKTGYDYACSMERPLWQPSYVDRVLRNDEDTWDVVRYMLQNPVRAGLAETFDAYAYSGSGTVSREELARALEVYPGRSWQP